MIITASCKSSNKTFLIMCRRHGQQYVGENGQPLHSRINGWCHNIMHQSTEESPVAAHFNTNAHMQLNMAVMVTNQLHSNDPCPGSDSKRHLSGLLLGLLSLKSIYSANGNNVNILNACVACVWHND